MSEDTKLCPYCAEEIKAAAIVCKHCGRDLPEYEELKPSKPQLKSKKIEKEAQPSAWSGGRKLGTVVVIIYIISTVVNSYNPVTGISYLGGDFYGKILFGSLAIFLVFTTIGAGYIILKRKYGWLNKALLIGTIMMPILLVIVTAPRGERKFASENTPTLTQVTPKTATPSNTGLLSDEAKEAFIMYANSCMSWEQFTYYESVSNSVCVYGEIVKIQTVVRSGYSDVTFFRFSSSAGHIMLAGDAFAFAELQPNIGECVRAMGIVYNFDALYYVSLGDGTWAKINNSYCD